MRIGINCFSDIEIRSIIETSGQCGHCDITNVDNVIVYDTEMKSLDLSEYFSEIIDVYTPESELLGFPDEELKNIEDVLFSDWSLFNVEPIKIKEIVKELCKDSYPSDSKIYSERVGLEVLCNSSFLDEHCLMKQSTWERFTSSLKSINRFHSRNINLKQFERMFENSNFQYIVKKGDNNFFRGRISEEKLKVSEMGPPPAHLATAGRANANGISCLYLAGDEITTLHEIRARDLDSISIGRFEAKYDLRLIDLAELDKISPFRVNEIFTYEWLALNMPILKKISQEIAKPLRRQDSELDYLPSQYISDYIKSLGYDGIRYRSTLNVEGMNYAIFNRSAYKCIDVKHVHVKGLTFEVTEM